MDPATEGFVLQSLAAAAISGPIVLRTQIAGAVRRVRRRWTGIEAPLSEDACTSADGKQPGA